MERDIVYFRIDETGMSWPQVPVTFTINTTGLSFDEVTAHCDDIAFRVCLIEQRIVRWNRPALDGLGQGHYTDPWYVNRVEVSSK